MINILFNNLIEKTRVVFICFDFLYIYDCSDKLLA